MENPNLESLPAAQRQQSNRIRVRRARSITAMALDAISTASVEGHARHVDHGGGVANCYGYPAETQAAGVSVVRVADGVFRVLAGFAILPANKVTRSGAAAETLGYRGPWDDRCGTRRAHLDRLDVIADTLSQGVRIEVARS
jgi:hypothetical protein